MWIKTEANKPLHDGVISAITFTGTGTDDLEVSGSPAFAASRSYEVEMDSANETFKWSNDGGATWEEEDLPIHVANSVAYPLRNAEGELEGISIRFASNTGHDNGDNWAFTTTGTVVANAETDVGAGTVLNARSADAVILHGQYSKGAEDGLRLKLVPLMAGVGSSYHNQLSLPLNLGNGGLRHQQEFFEMTATANYTYRVDLAGIGAFQVRQVRSGAVGGTGLFTCNATLYKILR